MHAAGLRRRPTGIGLTMFVGEDCNEPSIARIKIKMALGRVVEIGLLKHEGHTEHALPEIDRRLAVGARQRDVVNTLALKLLHGGMLHMLGLYHTGVPPAHQALQPIDSKE